MGLESAEQDFLAYLAEKTGVEQSDILDFDLYLYSVEEPSYVGMKQEFISAPHLDNTTSIQALLDGITGEVSDHGINLAAMFDHEEIGSRTAQGAASMQLLNLLKKILKSLPHPVCEDVLYDSMMVSVDVAHGIHPNHPGKADPVLAPKLGQGFCIKEACSQSYATDSRVVAVIQQICDSYNIPYQKYANRSDIPGGGTLGSIATSFLPIAIADVGIPLLAMHSVRELMGTADMDAMSEFISSFFRG
jgi:aspartyl aminopeptidase